MAANNSLFGFNQGPIPPMVDMEPPPMSPTVSSENEEKKQQDNDWCDFSGFVSSSTEQAAVCEWTSFSPPPLSNSPPSLSPTVTKIKNSSSADEYSTQLQTVQSTQSGTEDEPVFGLFYKDDTISDKISNNFDDSGVNNNFENIYFKNDIASSSQKRVIDSEETNKDTQKDPDIKSDDLMKSSGTDFEHFAASDTTDSIITTTENASNGFNNDKTVTESLKNASDIPLMSTEGEKEVIDSNTDNEWDNFSNFETSKSTLSANVKVASQDFGNFNNFVCSVSMCTSATGEQIESKKTTDITDISASNQIETKENIDVSESSIDLSQIPPIDRDVCEDFSNFESETKKHSDIENENDRKMQTKVSKSLIIEPNHSDFKEESVKTLGDVESFSLNSYSVSTLTDVQGPNVSNECKTNSFNEFEMIPQTNSDNPGINSIVDVDNSAITDAIREREKEMVKDGSIVSNPTIKKINVNDLSDFGSFSAGDFNADEMESYCKKSDEFNNFETTSELKQNDTNIEPEFVKKNDTFHTPDMNSSIENQREKSNDDFGSFSAFDSTSKPENNNVKVNDDNGFNFDDFKASVGETSNSKHENNPNPLTTTSNDVAETGENKFGDFGDFDSAIDSSENTDAKQNSFSIDGDISNKEAGNNEFGDFGVFDVNSGNTNKTTFNNFGTSDDVKKNGLETNDFGNFGSIGNEFGNFNSVDEEFGEFGNFNSEGNNVKEDTNAGFASFETSSLSTSEQDSWNTFTSAKSVKKPSILSTACTNIMTSLFGSPAASESKKDHDPPKQRIYDILDLLKNSYKPDSELTLWDELHIADEDEERWLIYYFASHFFKQQILSFSCDYIDIKMRGNQKSIGQFSASLSPTASIASFDMDIAVLVPEQATIVSKNTLLAQVQTKKLPSNLIERIPSLSSLKKGDDSESTSETTSLDLDFFMSGNVPAQVVGKEPSSTKDLLDIDLALFGTEASNESSSNKPDAISEEFDQNANDSVFSQEPNDYSAILAKINANQSSTATLTAAEKASNAMPSQKQSISSITSSHQSNFPTFPVEQLNSFGDFTNSDNTGFDHKMNFPSFQTLEKQQIPDPNDKYAVFSMLSTEPPPLNDNVGSAISQDIQPTTATRDIIATTVQDFGDFSIVNETTSASVVAIDSQNIISSQDFGTFSSNISNTETVLISNASLEKNTDPIKTDFAENSETLTNPINSISTSENEFPTTGSDFAEFSSLQAADLDSSRESSDEYMSTHKSNNLEPYSSHSETKSSTAGSSANKTEEYTGFNNFASFSSISDSRTIPQFDAFFSATTSSISEFGAFSTVPPALSSDSEGFGDFSVSVSTKSQKESINDIPSASTKNAKQCSDNDGTGFGNFANFSTTNNSNEIQKKISSLSNQPISQNIGLDSTNEQFDDFSTRQTLSKVLPFDNNPTALQNAPKTSEELFGDFPTVQPNANDLADFGDFSSNFPSKSETQQKTTPTTNDDNFKIEQLSFNQNKPNKVTNLSTKTDSFRDLGDISSSNSSISPVPSTSNTNIPVVPLPTTCKNTMLESNQPQTALRDDFADFSGFTSSSQAATEQFGDFGSFSQPTFSTEMTEDKHGMFVMDTSKTLSPEIGFGRFTAPKELIPESTHDKYAVFSALDNTSDEEMRSFASLPKTFTRHSEDSNSGKNPTTAGISSTEDSEKVNTYGAISSTFDAATENHLTTSNPASSFGSFNAFSGASESVIKDETFQGNQNNTSNFNTNLSTAQPTATSVVGDVFSVTNNVNQQNKQLSQPSSSAQGVFGDFSGFQGTTEQQTAVTDNGTFGDFSGFSQPMPSSHIRTKPGEQQNLQFPNLGFPNPSNPGFPNSSNVMFRNSTESDFPGEFANFQSSTSHQAFGQFSQPVSSSNGFIATNSNQQLMQHSGSFQQQQTHPVKFQQLQQQQKIQHQQQQRPGMQQRQQFGMFPQQFQQQHPVQQFAPRVNAGRPPRSTQKSYQQGNDPFASLTLASNAEQLHIPVNKSSFNKQKKTLNDMSTNKT